MINFAKQLKLSNVSFIMDQGFETEEKLLYMYKNNYKFIIPLPESRTISKQWIEKYCNTVVHWDNYIPEYNMYGKMFSETIYGIPIHGHMYFDAEKLSGADKGMQTAIIKLEQKINEEKNISSMERLPRQYSQYFALIDNGDGTKSIIKDPYKIETIRSRHGFFILLTTDEKLTTTQTLSNYKQRDVIEKNYFALKSGIDMTILRTHEDNASKGKLFVSFIALIIRAYLLQIKKNSENNKFKYFSFPDIIRNLSLIDLRVHNGIADAIGIGPNQTKILDGLSIPDNLFLTDYMPTFRKEKIPLKISY
jgi:transposase